MKKKLLTLCLIRRGDEILLGMKKRGFGAGRWNGFGGKLSTDESLEDGAKREFKEEAGLIVNDIELMGKIDFEFLGDPEVLEVNIFNVKHFEGEPIESEEMLPKWFHIGAIPYDQMWPDDKHWFPLFLEGKKFRGKFTFQGQDKIVSHELDQVKEV